MPVSCLATDDGAKSVYACARVLLPASATPLLASAGAARMALTADAGASGLRLQRAGAAGVGHQSSSSPGRWRRAACGGDFRICTTSSWLSICRDPGLLSRRSAGRPASSRPQCPRFRARARPCSQRTPPPRGRRLQRSQVRWRRPNGRCSEQRCIERGGWQTAAAGEVEAGAAVVVEDLAYRNRNEQLVPLAVSQPPAHLAVDPGRSCAAR